MTQPVKVLQLGSPTGLYGAERWILALIKNLDKEKVRSLVASVKDAPGLEVPLCLESDKLGIPSYIIDSYGRFNFSGIARLRSFIVKEKIDLIHTHGYKTDLMGLLAVRGTDCKIISTPHGWTEAPDIKLQLYEIMDRLIFPLFDAVVPLSEELFKSLRFIPGLKKKVHLIKNGVDLNEVEEGNRVALEILSLKGNRNFLIGYIGRLTPGKGLDILLKAVAKYGENNWNVVLVGDGDQENLLRVLAEKLGIKDRVNFFGFRSDRLDFLRGFDTFVLPSRSEGIPRCLMEAMASGVPVIASDIPGCRTLVDGEKTGLLFPVDNPSVLAKTIEKFSSDREFMKKIAQGGRNFIQKNFSAKRMAEEYATLYLNLKNHSKISVEPVEKVAG